MVRRLTEPRTNPKHNSDVANLAYNCGVFDLLLDWLRMNLAASMWYLALRPKMARPLGAVKLNEPILRNSSKGKGVYFRFKGLRPKTAKTAEGKKRYFTTGGMSEPLRVQRIDREWIFERGGKGFSPQIDQARICMIRCVRLGRRLQKI